MGLSVQFIDKKGVLSAYTSRQVDIWSLWQGKQFMFKGEGLMDLETVLDALSENSTNAIYTLKIYEDLKDLNSLKSNTPDDGSFNFRLNSESQILPVHKESSYFLLTNKIEALEKKIEELESDAVSDEEKPGLGIIGQVIGNPAVAALIPVLIDKLINFLSDSKKSVTITEGSNASVLKKVGEIEMNNDIDLFKIVSELKLYDHDLKDHLNILLKMAKENNVMFNQIVGMIDKL